MNVLYCIGIPISYIVYILAIEVIPRFDRKSVENETQKSVRNIDMLVVNAYGACVAVERKTSCFNVTEPN